MDEAGLIVGETSNWQIIVRQAQHTLGMLVIVYKDKSISSLTELNNEHLIELKDLLLRLEQILKGLYQADRFNYLQAGNENPSLHIHVIPRYEALRVVNGVEFTDEGMQSKEGKLWIEKDKTQWPDEEVVRFITKQIKSKFIQGL